MNSRHRHSTTSETITLRSRVTAYALSFCISAILANSGVQAAVIGADSTQSQLLMGLPGAHENVARLEEFGRSSRVIPSQPRKSGVGQIGSVQHRQISLRTREVNSDKTSTGAKSPSKPRTFPDLLVNGNRIELELIVAMNRGPSGMKCRSPFQARMLDPPWTPIQHASFF
jgi:hypothetical protein